MKPSALLRIIASAFAIKAGGSALAVLMFMAIGRASTVAAFGDFAFGFSASQFFAVIFGLGAETVALRTTSATLASGGAENARAQAALALKVTLAGMAGAMMMGLGAIGFGIDPQFALSISALASLLALSETLSSVLRGYGGIALALVPREVLWRLAVLVLAGAAWARGLSLDAAQWLWLSSALLAVVLVVQWFSFGDRPSRSDICRIDGDERKILLYVSRHWHIWIIAVLNGFGTQLPILLVRGLIDAEATALLFAAMKISALIALPLVASGPVVAPQISRAWALRDMEELQQVGVHTAAFTSAGALIGLAVVLFVGRPLLGWFGPEFVAAQPSVIVLALGQVFAALVGPTGFAMLMMGHERIALMYLAAATFIAVILTLGLTLMLGIVGAAAGISSLLLINKGACYLYLVRRYGVHLSLLGWFTKPHRV